MTKNKTITNTISDNTFSTNAIAELFSVSDRTIRNWCDEGMPKKSHGRFNIIDCFNWWNENLNKATKKEETARERYWMAKAEREELAVKKLLESVIEKEDLEQEWCKRIQEIIKGLSSQEAIFPDLLTDKPKEYIRKKVQEYNHKLRANYSRYGKYTPVEMKEIKKTRKRTTKKTNIKKTTKKVATKDIKTTAKKTPKVTTKKSVKK